jgi:hypothetical protein
MANTDFLDALESNGKIIAQSLGRIVSEMPVITSAFQGIMSGDVDEKKAETALDLYNEHIKLLSQIYDSVILTVPTLEKPKEASQPGLPPSEPSVIDSASSRVAITSQSGIGLPGTLTIEIKSLLE